MFYLIATLFDCFKEIELTYDFMDVDRAKIPLLYGDTIDPGEYYTYQYDNFVIRLVTILDLCAKIGITIFKLPISERFCTPNTFCTHKITSETIAKKALKELINFLDTLKENRHLKLHQGKRQGNSFEKVLFWSELNEAIGNMEPPDEALEEYTDSQIKGILKEIRNTMEITGTLVVTFPNSLQEQLQVIVS